MPIGHRAAVPHGGRPGAAVAQGQSAELLRDRLFWPAWFGAGALVLAVAARRHGLCAAAWRSASAGSPPVPALRQLVLATRRQGWRGLVGRANGGMIVHIGVIIIAVALAALEQLHHVERAHAQRRPAGRVRRPHVRAGDGHVVRGRPLAPSVQRRACCVDGEQVYAPAHHHVPRLRPCRSARRACAPALTDDVYLTLDRRAARPATTTAAGQFVKPLIVWLWIGGALMAVGTLLAAFPGAGAPADRPGVGPRQRAPALIEADTPAEAGARRRHRRRSPAPARRTRGIAPLIALGVAVVLAGAVRRARRRRHDRRPTAGRTSPSASRRRRCIGTPLDGATVRPVAGARAAGSCSTSSTRRACPCSRSTPSWSSSRSSSARSARRRRALHGRLGDDQQTRRRTWFFADNGGDWPVVIDTERLDRRRRSAWPRCPRRGSSTRGRHRPAPSPQITADVLSRTLQQLREPVRRDPSTTS